MNVLLSIKPIYAAMILDGKKRYEYRRVIFSTPYYIDKVYIYSTAPVKKVIGEFKVDVILNDTPRGIWERTHEWGGIGKEEFFGYFAGKDRGYAIAIKDVVKYENPIPLPFRPPQNYRYCEVLDYPKNIHSPSSADSSELEASNPMQQENP